MKRFFAAAIAIALMNFGHVARAQNTDSGFAGAPESGTRIPRSWAKVSYWEATYRLTASADNVPCESDSRCTIRQGVRVAGEILKKFPGKLEWISGNTGYGGVSSPLNDLAVTQCPKGSPVGFSMLRFTGTKSGQTNDVLKLFPAHGKFIYDVSPATNVSVHYLSCEGKTQDYPIAYAVFPADTTWPPAFDLPTTVGNLMDGFGPIDLKVFPPMAGTASWTFDFTLIPH